MKVGLLLALLVVFVTSQSIVNPTTAVASVLATPVAGGSGYTYLGCYNETVGIAGAGGVRALSDGKNVGLIIGKRIKV